MSEEDFKRLLKNSLKPIREEQAELRRSMESSLKPIREEQKGLIEEYKELRKIIEERVLPPLMYVEATVKSYADRYVANEDHIRRLDKRLYTVEENLGIQPPEELTIPVLD